MNNPTLKISPDVGKALTALGEACKQAVEALVKVARASVDFVVTMYREVDFAQLLEGAVVVAAIREAQPRVRHLAKHGRKRRTRKKNSNRALREYQRRHDRVD